ncbi:MAG TPA: PAS domain S-box protein, partial [Burkholderiales bacterium]|nr:PAS domain S-box protein [Burkholderiales bacterium]
MEDKQAGEPAHGAAASCDRPFDATRSFDQAGIGLAHISPDGIVFYVNARMCELLGCSPGDILGRRAAELTYGPDVDVEARTRKALIDGEVSRKTDEKRLLRKDGRVIWVRRWLTVVRGAAGAPEYLVGAYDDITDTKLTAERYRAIFDNAAVGITQVRLDGVLVDVNDKFCEMLGYTREELRGKSIRDITPAEDYGAGASFRERIVQGQLPAIAGEKRLIRKDGAIL